MSGNGAEVYKFKAKTSGISVAQLCLGNASKNVLADNMKLLVYVDILLLI